MEMLSLQVSNSDPHPAPEAEDMTFRMMVEATRSAQLRIWQSRKIRHVGFKLQIQRDTMHHCVI